MTAAREGGHDGVIGIVWYGLGDIALRRNRPDEAVPALRQALDAFAQAGNEGGQMRTLNWLGNADRQRGHTQAALEWYEKALRYLAVEGSEFLDEVDAARERMAQMTG